jgi:1-acyl-sn-glycerol-3-phosphate acyltransferase
MLFRSIYYLPVYYASLFFFAIFGLGLCLFSFLAGMLPSNQSQERFFQRLIHYHFALFHGWCQITGTVRITYEGFGGIPSDGCVIVANHPSLIDITCLLARIPEAVCIFKPAIRRNPVLGAAARRAGYLASDGGHELLRRATEKVEAGHNLIIFPEGTRTLPGSDIGPFKPGFVIIARRAGVPIQLIRVTTDSDVLTKGSSWWKLPRFPANVVLEAGPVISGDVAGSPAAVSAHIEDWFRKK